MIPHPNFRHLLKVAVLLAVATQSQAEPVLSLIFDDPNGQAATVRDTEISSGTGGVARLQSRGIRLGGLCRTSKDFPNHHGLCDGDKRISEVDKR